MPIPRIRDKVYSLSQKDRGLQPNGFIRYVDYEDDEVFVIYHSDQRNKTHEEVYQLGQFEGKWKDIFGGTWWLDEE